MFIRWCPAGSDMGGCERASCEETPVRHTSDYKVGTMPSEIGAAVYTLPFAGVNGPNSQSCNHLG
jgi:hypothetical protein